MNGVVVGVGGLWDNGNAIAGGFGVYGCEYKN